MVESRALSKIPHLASVLEVESRRALIMLVAVRNLRNRGNWESAAKKDGDVIARRLDKVLKKYGLSISNVYVDASARESANVYLKLDFSLSQEWDEDDLYRDVEKVVK